MISDKIQILREAIEKACARCGRLPHEVLTVVVTKQRSLHEITAMYDAGFRDFGENRPQALLERQQECKADVNWHLIGPLQMNKVAKIQGRVSLIHSVNSFELGKKLSVGDGAQVLLQVNVSGEKTKQGLAEDEVASVYEQLLALPSLKIVGLMTMAPRYDHTVESEKMIRSTFAKTRELLFRLQQDFSTPKLCELSMGMSGDFEWAIEEGATIIRIGSFLFG